MSLPGPVRVAVVDVASPLQDLDCTRAQAPAYESAWVLAHRDGYPLGSVELVLSDTTIAADALERELQRALGDVWSRGPRADGAAVALPRASVVVPTALSRLDQLHRCVAALRSLDYPDFEVIVVDNRSAGDPVQLPGVRVVRESRPGISAARNRGLAVASGEIVAFTDDDVEVDRRWLRALAERFVRQPEVVAVTGLVIPAELETPAQLLFEQSGSGLDRGYEPLTFERSGRFGLRRRSLQTGSERVYSLYQAGELGLGSNLALRASALRAMGGFDLALGVGTPSHGGEDLAMLMELIASGHVTAYEPGAIVHHTHRASMPDLERQIHGYGVGFTAMLTALIVRNPRHLAGLASAVPAWLRARRHPENSKRSGRGDAYPQRLERAELRGMLAGPGAYLRSRRLQRRWTP